MDEVVRDFIKDMKLSAGVNTQCIFEAWDSVSGVSQYTTRKFFRDGILYITLSSSVARARLSSSLDQVMRKVNDKALSDPLFVKDAPRCRRVTKIVLK